VLVAASVGVVLYLAFNMDAHGAAIVAVAMLAALMLYNSVRSRLRDRVVRHRRPRPSGEGSFPPPQRHRTRVDRVLKNARGSIEPLQNEIGELGVLVRQIAETVASRAAPCRLRVARQRRQQRRSLLPLHLPLKARLI
jgi:hypothetical protein